ncbi:NAD(P)-binding protein [Apiospora saccharicola]
MATIVEVHALEHEAHNPLDRAYKLVITRHKLRNSTDIPSFSFQRPKQSIDAYIPRTGRPFEVRKANVEDLEAGELKSSWDLEAVHKAVSQDQAAAFQKTVSIGFLLSSAKGAWDSSDAMNQVFPDYEFTSAEAFLKKVWAGKP